MGVIAIIISLFLVSCSDPPPATNKITLPYDIAEPVLQATLPSTLHEVSGITHIDSTLIACVQDEHGFIFMYDIARQVIASSFAFGYDGDYEGIAKTGGVLFVLRSDGSLYEVPDFRTGKTSAIAHALPLPQSNYEGLCHDAENNRLLIASKGKVEEGSKEDRYVYAFDLNTRKLLPRPAYRFSIVEITQFAVDQGIHEPYRLTPKGKSVPNYLKMRTSELAIHPVTGHLYVLAATDHLLLVFDKTGQILHIQKLDPKVFNQAEGLTFTPDGDMFISNEGGEGEPTLLQFRYKG